MRMENDKEREELATQRFELEMETESEATTWILKQVNASDCKRWKVGEVARIGACPKNQ